MPAAVSIFSTRNEPAGFQSADAPPCRQAIVEPFRRWQHLYPTFSSLSLGYLMYDSGPRQ